MVLSKWPDEVIARIRRPMPEGCDVLEGSLPVVAFGDPQKARVATLALNPSDVEFRIKKGWLTGADRRLESLASLGASRPQDLSDEQVAAVLTRSDEYFRHNPYLSWFGKLEAVLADAGLGSYFDGSACHLDLVQWATATKQGSLAPDQWERLVKLDQPFLRWQLSHYNIKMVLINGEGAKKNLVAHGILLVTDEKDLPFVQAAGNPATLKVTRGLLGETPVIAWNKPLAKPLSADGLQTLKDWIRNQATHLGITSN